MAREVPDEHLARSEEFIGRLRDLGAAAPGGYAQPAASAAPAGPLPPPPPAAPPAEPKLQADAPPAPQPAQAAADRGARRMEREAPRGASDPCSTACTALASMERAATHLCGLAGAADNRCTSARERVKNATARVQAACPACAG